MLRIKNNEFVIPGQLIGSRIICDTNCFYENGKVYSAIQGIARVIGNRVIIIPSSGTYVPKEGDIVIGVVKN
ncbi:MAG: RNA-binding protein, partial [Candidatus Altiarchaeales archaeon]